MSTSLKLCDAYKIFTIIKILVHKHLKAFLIVCLLFLVTLHLPKVEWLCCKSSEHDHDKYKKTDLSFQELSRKLRVGEPTSRSGHIVERRNLPDEQTHILRMFPIYLEIRAHTINNTTTIPVPRVSQARVRLFTLKNHNFKNFNRFWENKEFNLQRNHRNSQQKTGKKEVPYDPGAILDLIEEDHVLPECITLRFRRPLQPPTKVCVHSRREDNVISNQLRDFGNWEPDLLDQMQTFLEHSPKSQLVDLGCNTGVYTLLAARLGRPVLAVDALPANLALLQLAVLTNDRAALEQGPADDLEDLLQFLAKTRNDDAAKFRIRAHEAEKTPPRPVLFSELITSLHNAVYSKRIRMFVDITDEPNLGGMEVKELPFDYQTRSRSSRPSQADDSSHRVLVDAVCLDDLVPYVKQNLSIFLKMDIEGAEAHVLRCADHFFSALDVRVVQMEILLQRYSGSMGEMTEFFQRHNLWPSEDVNGRSMLGPEPSLWPDNMYWIKVR